MRMRFFVLWLLLFLSMGEVRADVNWLSVIWHNDVFLDEDGGGYTNGIYFSWYDMSAAHPDDFSPPWLLSPLMGWLIEDEGEDFAVNMHTLGQIMLTPKDITEPVPDPNDAPYAGLLFLSSGYLRVKDNQADKLRVTLGIVGPSSGAGSTQRFIHKVVGANRPEGWDYQIKDEPVGNIERIRIWRFESQTEGYAEADLLVLGGLSLGNLESSVGTSVIARYGSGLKRSFGTASQITGGISNPMAIDGGWNIYLGLGASYVYNQIFVSGSGIRSGPKADLRSDQFAAFGGASHAWDNITLSLSFVTTTPLDTRSTARQRFGALTIAWRL